MAGTNTAPIFNAMVAWPSLFSQNCQPKPRDESGQQSGDAQRQKRFRAAVPFPAGPVFSATQTVSRPTLQTEVNVLAMPSPPCFSGSTSTAASIKLSARQARLIFIGVLVSPSAKKARARMLTVENATSPGARQISANARASGRGGGECRRARKAAAQSARPARRAGSPRSSSRNSSVPMPCRSVARNSG